MFSLATKTFAGLTAITTILAFVVAVLQPDRLAVTLMFLAAAAFAMVTAAGRTATGYNDRAAVAGAAASANRAPRNSYAPAVAAIGGGVMVLGAALGMVAYLAGAVVLAAAAGLWFSDTWREHPLATPKASAQVSDSFSLPFLMPLLVLVLIAFVAVSFSLVFFSFPENQSWILASVVATLVFGGAFILAFLPVKATRARFLAMAGLLLAVIAAMGVLGLVRGEPEHGEHSETHSEGSGAKTSEESHSEG
jgi:hypothetical protein